MAAAAISAARTRSVGLRKAGSYVIPHAAVTDMPSEESSLHSGVLLKRVVNESVSWTRREMVLTADRLCVGRHNSEVRHVIEEIKLVEVDAVKLVELHPHLDEFKRFKTAGSTFSTTAGNLQNFSSSHKNHNTSQEPNFAIEIQTKQEGWHSGKKYIFGIPFSSPEDQRKEADRWVYKIQEAWREARVDTDSLWSNLRAKARRLYQTQQVQLGVGLIILANFGLSIADAQLVPEEGTKLFNELERIDVIFTVIFAVELLFNMLGTWFQAFWRDAWNCFDFVVVLISILSFILNDLPGLGLLRMMRVFRVIRVFRRLKSLAKVVKAVAAATVPVLNAFGVLTIVSCIYAVIAVQLYAAHEGANGNFQNFSAAIFTMFQVCTSDGWATDVVRPMFGAEGSVPDGSIAVFFVSYLLIVGTVLLNVVIAVLLDEFITSVAKDKAEDRMRSSGDEIRDQVAPLDPLLSTLLSFNTSRDLSDRIRAIYQVLDADDSGGLSYNEMADGLRVLHTSVPIALSLEDFDTITEHGALLDEKGELDIENFEIMVRRQLALFVQRRTAARMTENDGDDPVTTALLVLKQLTLGVEITGNDSRDNDGALSSFSPSATGAYAPPKPAPASQPYANGVGRSDNNRSTAGNEELVARLALLDVKVDSILNHLSLTIPQTAGLPQTPSHASSEQQHQERGQGLGSGYRPHLPPSEALFDAGHLKLRASEVFAPYPGSGSLGSVTRDVDNDLAAFQGSRNAHTVAGGRAALRSHLPRGEPASPAVPPARRYDVPGALKDITHHQSRRSDGLRDDDSWTSTDPAAANSPWRPNGGARLLPEHETAQQHRLPASHHHGIQRDAPDQSARQSHGSGSRPERPSPVSMSRQPTAAIVLGPPQWRAGSKIRESAGSGRRANGSAETAGLR